MPAETNPYSLLALIPAAPLAGAFLNGLLTILAAGFKKQLPPALAAFIAVSAAVVSFGLSATVFMEIAGLEHAAVLHQTLYTWISAGNLHIDLAFQADQLTAIMIMFVTFVASWIHIYAIGYMKGDDGFARFFTYLNLFLFSMLILVLGDSLTVMFVGWEGVGLCSYLLISFWFTDDEKAAAGKKAFITNRIGDAGLLIAMFVIFNLTGSLGFAEIEAKKELFTGTLATIAALALFVGATGKSAQLPLYVWLPDAMAGPTPVSALIHAATMVTAGVYLVARMHFLFALSPVASTVVAIIGTLTALFAATIAMAQNDIKKVLAYSTISQLGYMFLGVGVGAYSAGIFHVMTHAFFKACLFLGAGSVIHALHHEQDIRQMGGLLKKIPVTAVTFIVAWLAISGVPPFAGFFSKDEILWKALATENHVLPWLPTVLYVTGLVTALLTAFYMTRLVVLTFFGSYRGHHDHPKEHAVMTLPLVVLATFSLLAGFVGVPAVLGGSNMIEHFMHAVVGASVPEAHHVDHALELPLMALSVATAALGILAAFFAFLWKPAVAERFAVWFAALQKLLANKYYIDEIYEALILKPFRTLADVFNFRFIDSKIINNISDHLGPTAWFIGNQLRIMQNGRVRSYLYMLFTGMLLIAMIFYISIQG
ncbi:MAG: NADH-quinone oxidoreductase subunit L [Leptospiraceae bacterium]|nr:NADH-quinone oxidoreductase subunit L [Leptospiraceae bacterium]